MREVKQVDLYVDGALVLSDLTLNYEVFDMQSEEPQSITATAFLPHEDYFTGEKTLVIDFKDGLYAKARIYESTRLGDEYQTEMVIIDAGYSLAEML